MNTDNLPSPPAAPLPLEPPKVHLRYLDSMRALAALYVVFFHLVQSDSNWEHMTKAVRMVLMVLAHGHYAVCVFIVLSGFCLMLPVARSGGALRGGALAFFKKRARRILPSYYLACGLSLFLIWLCLGHKTSTDWRDAFPVTLHGVMAHLLLLQDLTEKTSLQIDYPLWSVSVEWRIYFVFPLLLILWRRLGALPTTLMAVAAGYLLLAVFRHVPMFTGHIFTGLTGASPEFLGLFALGMLGAGITYSPEGRLCALRSNIPWVPTVAIATVVALLLTTLKLSHGRVLEPPILGTVIGVWATIVLITAGQSDATVLHRFLSWRPLAFVGTFAYSIYLIHAPVLQFLWLYLIVPLRLTGDALFLVELFVVVPITLGASYLFFLACERPFLARRVVLGDK